MRAKTLILIMIAMCCGLLATIGLSQFIDRHAKAGPAPETEQIFVAATDIDIGDAFSPENVRLEEWPKDRVPDGAIRKLEDLENRYARQRLYAGEPVMTMKLMDSNSDTTMTIPEGYRACSIKVSGEVVVGNLVKPGDRVDVIVFLRRSNDVPITGTRTILRDVRVFAVNAKTEREVDEKGQVTTAQTISLLVTPKQVEILTLASQLGSLRLSLRRPNDVVDTDEGNTTVESFLESNHYSTASSSDDGGLLEMLRNFEVPSVEKKDSSEETQPVSTPTAFSMIVHSPQGLVRYDWQDEKQLPSMIPMGTDAPATQSLAPWINAAEPEPESKPAPESEPESDTPESVDEGIPENSVESEGTEINDSSENAE